MNITFYLTTVGEYTNLTEPRACQGIGRVKGYNRDDYILVKINPVLSGQNFGLGGEDIDHLILATTLEGETLFESHRWPISVYVGRITDKAVFETLSFELGQVELIAKGFLYQNANEAAAAAKTKF